jgi:Lon protease-like protein
MVELPLFPLNLVLFPGMPLQLHIFEERYKQMVQHCLRGDRLFGVALIENGVEALGPLAEPASTGCMARILEVEPLDEGRMNLMVVGKERFRILAVDRSSAPYLTGMVEPLPLRVEGEVDRQVRRLRERIDRYVQLVIRLTDHHQESDPLPDEPELVAYLAAMLLQVPLLEKQAFLEADSLSGLVGLLNRTLDRELPLTKALMAESSRNGIGVFSRN